MANFSPTWNNPTNPTNFAGARALNKAELNSSYYLLAKRNPQNTPESNLGLGTASTGATAYTAPTGTRAGNVTYTYTGTTPRLIMISITLTSSATLTAAGGTASVTLQVKDDTDGALATFQSGSIAASPAVTGGVQSETVNMYAIVNPPLAGTAQYRLAVTNTANASVTLVNWTEINFSAVHAPVTYTHGQVISSIDTLNRYANGINAQCDLDAALTQEFNMVAAGTGTNTNVDQLRFLSIQTTDISTVNMDNPGGSITTAVSTIGCVQGTLAFVKTAFVPIAPFGIYRYSGATAANANAANRIGLNVHASPITFTAGESGTTTGNKFRDLDAKNINGCNVTKKMVRTSHGTNRAATFATGAWFIYVNTHTLPASTAAVINQFQVPNGNYARNRIVGAVLTSSLAVQNNLAGVGLATTGNTAVSYANSAGDTLNASFSWRFAPDT